MKYIIKDAKTKELRWEGEAATVTEALKSAGVKFGEDVFIETVGSPPVPRRKGLAPASEVAPVAVGEKAENEATNGEPPTDQTVAKMLDDGQELSATAAKKTEKEIKQKVTIKKKVAKKQAAVKKKVIIDVPEDNFVHTPIPESIIGEPSEAEKVALAHKAEIETMAIQAEVMFLNMGKLLYDARENGEWALLHYESWKEYVEDLKLPMTNSYSWATRLSNIYEYLSVKLSLSNELLSKIGVAKLTRLLPAARQGKLTAELLEKAIELSDLDLRAELGHNVGGGGDAEDFIVCPKCGNQFDAKKASRVK